MSLVFFLGYTLLSRNGRRFLIITISFILGLCRFMNAPKQRIAESEQKRLIVQSSISISIQSSISNENKTKQEEEIHRWNSLFGAFDDHFHEQNEPVPVEEVQRHQSEYLGGGTRERGVYLQSEYSSLRGIVVEFNNIEILNYCGIQ